MKLTTHVVNDVMCWLNQKYGLALPVSPLAGWSHSVVALWQKAVNKLPDDAPLPQSIDVEGDWQPLAGSRFTVTQIRIVIRQSDTTSSTPSITRGTQDD
ncbi:hypothetical protein DET57_10580 [Klebsiella oxytoca]|uniref:Uncharacterized protein n=1 Tax=Klebsiella oxytoca TaxID=571 RepID=A0A318FSV2_KLEOX|nr:hypothetical protein [Klebsiella oxytoca]PXW46406.1 hypothetical protein DET57_10580 [Klebsiella oxytoca]HCB1501403.1 hypothetical protein [Klebsiella michiganensis]HCB1847699.1 hypothetical protein [Klebsiella oxytoca]